MVGLRTEFINIPIVFNTTSNKQVLDIWENTAATVMIRLYQFLPIVLQNERN